MRSYADCTSKPLLQVTSNAFKVTLPNRNTNSQKAAGNGVSFSENEAKVITLLDKRGEIIRKDVETALNISQAMAVRILSGLVGKEVIRVIGGGKKTRYVLP